jgi:hypothetical protein
MGEDEEVVAKIIADVATNVLTSLINRHYASGRRVTRTEGEFI